MGTVTVVGLLLLSIVLLVSARKRWINSETLQTLANIAAIVALVAAALVFIVPAATPSDSPSIINGDPNGNNQLQAVVFHTPTPSAQSVCGNVLDLEFLQNDDQIETNNGRWRLVLAEGSSICWYKVTRAGITSGEEADTAIGAGPFRMGMGA